jgi:ABC-type hemin transport system ATPase subunit
VPVLTAEDLVIAKVLAQRPKDLEDVRSVLRAQPTLDLAHVRRVLRDLEEALQQSDLLPVLEDLVAAGATGPR